MIEGSGEENLDQPPEEVFDFVADAATEPLWNPDVISCEQTSPGPVRPGSTRRGEYKHIGVVESTVVDYERPNRLEFRAHAKHAHMTIEFRFSPRSDGGTHMRVRGRLSLKGPLRLTEMALRGTVAHQYADRARAIKQALDARQPA